MQQNIGLLDVLLVVLLLLAACAGPPSHLPDPAQPASTIERRGELEIGR